MLFCRVVHHTGQYGFVAAMAPRSGLFRAAFPTHDALVFGAERLLGQVLVALCAAETLFVPVSTLMVQLLMARAAGERRTREVELADGVVPLTPQGWAGGTRRRSWRRTWCGSGRRLVCLHGGQTFSLRGPPDSRNSVSCQPSLLWREDR